MISKNEYKLISKLLPYFSITNIPDSQKITAIGIAYSKVRNNSSTFDEVYKNVYSELVSNCVLYQNSKLGEYIINNLFSKDTIFGHENNVLSA